MRVILDLKHVGSGRFFLASGKRRPDAYRFERVAGQEHIHRLIVPGDKMEDVLEDLALRLQQADIPVAINVVLDDEDRISDDLIAELRAEIEVKGEKITELTEKLRRKSVEKPAAPTVTSGGLSDDEKKMLNERDEFVLLLGPLATGEETPLQTLVRLTQAKPVEPAQPASDAPVTGSTGAGGGEKNVARTGRSGGTPRPKKPKKDKSPKKKPPKKKKRH